MREWDPNLSKIFDVHINFSILGCLAVDAGVNKEIRFLPNLRGKPFHDIKGWILRTSFWKKSSLLQILWARRISARISRQSLIS